MGKKGVKEYTRICASHNTFFEGYKVPVGAMYGRTLVPYHNTNTFCIHNDYVFWVCDNFEGLKKGVLNVHISKKEWGFNDTCDNIHKIIWHDIKVGRNHPVYKHVLNACREYGSIPTVKTFKDPQIYIDRECSRISREFDLRKHPEPTSRCYKQAQVDGRGYDISWEENVQPMKDSYGYDYNGMSVPYPNGQKQACFTPFEGITDTYEARRRDGMKVNQTKCRPEKKQHSNTIISVKINGVMVAK